MEEWDPDTVERRLDDLQVVDVRPRDEYAESHIPGAESLPMGEFAAGVADRDWGDAVVLVCHVGEASVRAARLLEAYEETADATVASMAGGYRAWDGPLETGAGDAAETGEGPADRSTDDGASEAPF
jgi:rhodanese-related sulfurtransferase